MATVDLTAGGGSKTYTIDGSSAQAGTAQKIDFVCEYSTSGYLTIKMQIRPGGWNFSTSNAVAAISCNGSKQTLKNHVSFSADKNSTAVVGTWGNYVYTTGTYTVSYDLDMHADGWGPTPDGGWYGKTFTISVTGHYTIPNAGTTSCSQSNGTFSISWSGFSGGHNNSIRAYELWYQESTNNSSWSDRVHISNYSTTSSSYSTTWSGGTTGRYYRFCAVALGTVSGTYSSTTAFGNSAQKTQSISAPSAPTGIEITASPISSSNPAVYGIVDTNKLLGGTTNTAVKVLMCDYTTWRYVKVRPYGSTGSSFTYRTQYAVWSRNKNPLTDTPDLVNWGADASSIGSSGYDSNWKLNETTRSPGVYVRYRADASNSAGTSPGWTYSPVCMLGGSVDCNESGVWRQRMPWINVSGTWKPVYAVWQNVSGTWRRMG